jgi:membrane-associated phospholipid phosphatase
MKYRIDLVIVVLLMWIMSYFLINAVVGSGYYDYSTFIDNYFLLIPFFVVVYMSAFALMFLTPLFLKNRKAYVFAFLTLMTTTVIFFISFPGTMSRPEILHKDFFSSILAWLYFVDAPHNLFPSSHVSLTMLNALILDNKWIYLWAALIILSTLFIKQHYFLDVIGGIIVAGIAYCVYKKFSP